jgi:hypothetical protein
MMAAGGCHALEKGKQSGTTGASYSCAFLECIAEAGEEAKVQLNKLSKSKSRSDRQNSNVMWRTQVVATLITQTG